MKKIFLLLFFFLNFEICYAETKIAYININHILNNSIVGKSISNHLNSIKEKKLIEFQEIEKQLSEKEKNILNKKNIIDEKEFNDEVNILKKEIIEYKNKKKQFNSNIDEQKIKYTKEVLKTLNSIISNHVEENSIEIVFSKKDIIIARKNLDITKPIMDLLNKKLTKIKF